MNDEAISNKEELTGEEISNFSLQSEEVWSGLDSDLLSSLLSEDLFSEEDKPESVHLSDEEDSSDADYDGDIFAAEGSGNNDVDNIKIIIDEVKKLETTIKLATEKYYTEEVRTRLPKRKKIYGYLERTQKGEQYINQEKWEKAKNCFEKALRLIEDLSSQELQLKQRIYCHDKLITINKQLNKDESVEYQRQEKEQAEQRLGVMQYKTQVQEIETGLHYLDSQEYVLHAFARELNTTPIEKTRLTRAKLQTIDTVLNKEEPFQSILEIVESFNTLARKYSEDPNRNRDLKNPIAELKSVLLETIKLYYKKVKTEKLTLDYSTMVPIEDGEVYRAVIDSTLESIETKKASNPGLLKQLAFVLYQDKKKVLSSNDCSKCMSLMCDELTGFETKRLEEQHACLDAIQALLDVWLHLGVHQFEGEQALPAFEFLEQNHKPSKEEKTKLKERPTLVEEYNELYRLLGEIKSKTEDNGNLWFKAACARQTLLHIGSDESRKALVLRKGAHFAKMTGYIGAAAGLLTLSTVTGKSIKAACSNLKEAGKEAIKGGHRKERKHRHYWSMRQFQSNIINFILISPLTNANEPRYQQQLAQLTDFLHLHRYFLFMAFNTLLDILNTNMMLLRGNIIDYSRCATLLTYCFASIDFSSNRDRRYVTIVLKELLSIHFKMCQKDKNSNFVPTLMNVFSELFPRFRSPLIEEENDVGREKGKAPMKEQEGASSSKAEEKDEKTKNKIKPYQSHKNVAREVVETITNLLIHLMIRPEAQDSCFNLLKHYAIQPYTTLKKGNPKASSYRVAKAVFACLEKLVEYEHCMEKAEELQNHLRQNCNEAYESYQKACRNNMKPMINVMENTIIISESRELACEAWSKTFPLDDKVRIFFNHKDNIFDETSLRDGALIILEYDQSKLEAKLKHKGYEISEWGRKQFDKARQMLPPPEKIPAEIQWEMHLRKHYQNDVNCYSVTLLFDEKRYIEDCFVNLTIVKQEKHREQVKQSLAEQQSNPLDRERYLSWYEDIHRDQDKEPIQIEGIFSERKNEDIKEQRKRFPRKILVHGWAGIGKTTLLRKIAFEWARGKLWKEQFKFVLWIRLRNLNTGNIAKQRNLETIIEIELFDKTGKCVITREQLKKFIHDQYPDQVLFLLDGFDELSQSTESAKAIHALLQNNKWHMIVTSRPTVTINADFDSVLETIGFTDENIEVYIQQFFKDDTEKAKQLVEYLKANPSIYGLAHIPINLELICSTYKEGLSEKNFTNMTQLYKGIEEKLWRRMIDNMPSSNRLSDSENEEKKFKEKGKASRYLQKLAFEGMKDNHYMLTKQDMLKAGEGVYYQRNQVPRLTFDDFKKAYLGKVLLSQFLHSPDDEQHKQQDYYFLHLTFQEYFAARYLSELLLSEDETNINEATNFIKNHKYEQRFQYLLWFTVGLLNLDANQEDEEYAEKGKRALNRFFEIFFQPPRDLIGDYEALFLIRCLEEGQLLKRLDEKYQQPVWNAVLDIIWRALTIDHFFKPTYLDKTAFALSQCPTLLQEFLIRRLFYDALLCDKGAIVNNTLTLLNKTLQQHKIEFLRDDIIPQLIDILTENPNIIFVKSILRSDIPRRNPKNFNIYWFMRKQNE